MPDRIEQAMDRLRAASQMSLSLYKTPLVIAYSGGDELPGQIDLLEPDEEETDER